MKQTHHIGYVQTPSVKNLSNVKNALVENGLVPLTTPNEMLPDAIVEGLKKLEFKDYGMIYEGKYRIRYFDIDGKILKLEYITAGGKLTPPTKIPNYDSNYLIFDEWNYDIENYIVEQPTDVGATYKTVDDATYMFCRFTAKTGLSIKIAITGYTSIDWGDGTVDTITSHTYAEEGDYLIKIKGTIVFTTSSSVYLLGSTTLNKTLKKIYINNYGSLGLTQYLCNYCSSLEIVSIPKGITSTNVYNFAFCYSLKHISLPNGITNIDTSIFENLYSLESISLPETITGSIYKKAFYNCYSLKDILLPKNIRTTYQSSFENCNTLKSLFISKGVNSISQNSFAGLRSLKELFIASSSIPTLQYVNGFSYVNSNCIFWVNDDIIEDLKVATNWSTYASQMKPLSWYPSLTDPNAE